MDTGELLIRWTVRVAMALYVASLTLRFSACGRRAWLDAARWAWTGGWVALLAHLAAAFHFVHQWSHSLAYEETARQTEAMTGLDWGGGVYANYVFALLWGGDVCWWWLAPVRYQTRPCWVEWAIQGFLAFIAFQATVVFGHGWIQWAGGAGTLLLARVFWRCRRKKVASAATVS